jgi:DNA-binding GntR family transcriptional regulator
VVEYLRTAILAGVLSGGTRLQQQELSARLGVSTTPVREAIRELAAEGIVRLDAYRGAVVHTPTIEEVQEVYELRLLLEPMAMLKAMNIITAEELRRAETLQAAMEETDDPADWVILNRRFHGTMLGAAKSPRLVSIIDRLTADATRQVALSIQADARRMTDGNREHRRILRALKRRDAEAVNRLVTEHLRSTVDAVAEHFRSEPVEQPDRHPR